MYLVNGIVYETKVALQSLCRDILDVYADGSILDVRDTDTVFDVLAMHPNAAEKIGVGVKAIGVRLNPTYKRNKEFVIYRTDGTFTEFSYQKCLRPPSHRARFILACRQAIASGIMAYSRQFFKANPDAVCPYTGETLTPQSSHVDHIHPYTFRRLLEDFIHCHKVDIDNVQLSSGQDNDCTVQILDKHIEGAWIEYHWKHAKLRVISAHANLSLGDRPEPLFKLSETISEWVREHIHDQMKAMGYTCVTNGAGEQAEL